MSTAEDDREAMARGKSLAYFGKVTVRKARDAMVRLSFDGLRESNGAAAVVGAKADEYRDSCEDERDQFTCPEECLVTQHHPGQPSRERHRQSTCAAKRFAGGKHGLQVRR